MEAPLDIPSSEPTLPSDAHLERAVNALAQAGNVRGAISVVEYWERHGIPSIPARLRQVECFLDLCMTDRAWTRLKGLEESSVDRANRLFLTGKMFLARGWGPRADEVLHELATLPSGQDALAELEALKSVPVSTPPEGLPQADAPLSEQLSAAEAFLTASSYFRAKRLLDRLKRDHGEDTRVSDLHWALAGDYEISPNEFHALISEFDHLPLPERTPPQLPPAEDRDAEAPFPGMFARPSAPEIDEGNPDGETTKITTVDDLKAALQLDADAENRDDDTQVLTVFDDLTAQPENTSEHAPKGTSAEMEREDDEVVVMTRRDGHLPPQQTVRPSRVIDPGPLAPPPSVTAPELDIEPIEAPSVPARTWVIALLVALSLLGALSLLVIGALT